jgi:hypothetical protein
VTAQEPVAVASAEDVRRAYDDTALAAQVLYDNVGITGVTPS